MFFRNLKLNSGIIHALLSLLIVSPLIYGGLHHEYDWSSNLLVFMSVFFAFLWGWYFSDWYVSQNKRIRAYKVYIATPVITIMASISSGGLHQIVLVISKGNGWETEIIPSFLLGIFFGIYAFFITSPITLISGIFIGMCLYRYKNNS